MLTVYGLKNCDSCRAARAYLKERDFVHAFHDLREDGLDPETLDKVREALGWEPLVNTKGPTFRQLPAARQQGLNAAKAQELMLEFPSLIKRPVIEAGDALLIGFDPDRYQELLGKGFRR